jgi:hypothetical protein
MVIMLNNNNQPICETDKYGDKRWYFNGMLHRVDGPAAEYANGTKYWCLNGQCHREDGPAIECANGDKFWYYQGKNLTIKYKCNTQEAFNRLLKLQILW